MSNDSQSHSQSAGAIKQFGILVGEWDTVGTHPGLPGPVQGHSKFEWLVEEGLLAWHFGWPGDSGLPTALSVIGRDDDDENCTMVYSDIRKISRVYHMTLEGKVWKMWRNAPEFSQRTTGTISEDGNTITCKGELSKDGTNWGADLDVTYTRVSSSEKGS
jgi:hypothetical protein